jgi:hypothetical protein
LEVEQKQETKQMRFNELAQDATQDDYGTWELDDTRRPKLTLRHLNKMRKKREMSKMEHMDMVNSFKDIYARPSGE